MPSRDAIANHTWRSSYESKQEQEKRSDFSYKRKPFLNYPRQQYKVNFSALLCNKYDGLTILCVNVNKMSEQDDEPYFSLNVPLPVANGHPGPYSQNLRLNTPRISHKSPSVRNVLQAEIGTGGYTLGLFHQSVGLELLSYHLADIIDRV